MPQHRALEWLHNYGRRYPKAWEQYAKYQEQHKLKGWRVIETVEPFPNWPDWCWCPLAGAHAIIAEQKPEELKKGDMRAPLPDTGGLGAVAAWRSTQGIYRFDPTLFEEVYEAPITGKVPWDVLRRLPEWCCYVEMPVEVDLHYSSGFKVEYEPGKRLFGFFVHLEWDVIEHTEVLRFALDVEGKDFLVPAMLHRAETVEDGLDRTFQYYRKAMIRRYHGDIDAKYIESMLNKEAWDADAELLKHLISVAVYLCCDENDVPRPAPRPDRFVTTKKGRKICPTPNKPQVYECGVRIGAALRWAAEQHKEAAEAGAPTGRTVHPHVRKAHYHHYWKGPRDGERTLIAHFLPSIQVNFKGAPPTPTLRPVQ